MEFFNNLTLRLMRRWYLARRLWCLLKLLRGARNHRAARPCGTPSGVPRTTPPSHWGARTTPSVRHGKACAFPSARTRPSGPTCPDANTPYLAQIRKVGFSFSMRARPHNLSTWCAGHSFRTERARRATKRKTPPLRSKWRGFGLLTRAGRAVWR